MCAIITWVGKAKRGQWPTVHRMLGELLMASSCRGTDATGFAALDGRGRFVVDKQPLASKKFVATSTAWRALSSPSCLVAHCRAATHGSPHTGDNRNNHPFLAPDLAVVVNGVAPNYRAVASRRGLRLTSECDSEVVMRLVEAAESPADGLAASLLDLDGGMAAAVLDAAAQTVWVARNASRPLWLIRLSGINGTFGCSTREIGEHALHAIYGRGWAERVEMLMPIAPYSITAMTGAGRLTTVSAERRTEVARGLLFP